MALSKAQQSALVVKAEQDAKAAVARETRSGLLLPRYTRSALEQMGWQRSYGAPRVYREAFMLAFADAWEQRASEEEGQ